MSKKMQDYDDFVEKFKPKKTTDDCYTPPLVYDAVLGWAREYLDIGDRPIVRPFYPGGDYEHYDYPENCVVIDNPPFSIFSKICDFYVERDIPFLLFAPSVTSIRPGLCYIGVGSSIIYENGACVNTGFVTNLLDDVCITAPTLRKMIDETVKKFTKQQKKTSRKYRFPDCVLRASQLNTMSLAGIDFRVGRNEGVVMRKVTTKKGSEFGNSILLSKEKTKEKLARKELARKELARKELARKELKAECLELTEIAKRIFEEGVCVYAVFEDKARFPAPTTG